MWVAWMSNRYGGLAGGTDILYKTIPPGGAWSQTPASNFTTTHHDTAPALAQLNNNTILLFWASKPALTWNIYYKRFNNNLWSDGVQLTSGLLNDTLNSAAVGRDGTLWLVWTRENATSTPTTRQLYYKVLKAGVWSQEGQLTSDANWNWGSSVVVGKDGKVRVVWVKGPRSSLSSQIFYKAYNGTSWGLETQISFLSPPFLSDQHPSIMQDRNGTVWVFWQRRIQVAPLVTKWAIFGRASADMGASWSERQITDPPCVILVTLHCFADQMPWAVQSTSDKSIWVYYSSTLDGSDPDIYALQSIPVTPVHDVDISLIKPSNSLQYQGGLKSIGQSPILTFNVTVANPGDFVETVKVNVMVPNTTSYNLGSLTGSVVAGGSSIFSFNWNTTGIRPALYSVSASVTTQGETLGNLYDNTFVAKNLVRILPLGNVKQDGNVDIIDVGIVFRAFGSTPGMPLWNPLADVHGNGIIDIIDAGVVARNFGITSPVSLVHDVAVSFVIPTASIQYPGGLVSIGQSTNVTLSVAVTDVGDFPETVQVSLVVSNVTSYSLGVLTGSVSPGGSVILVFNWNTANIKPGWYALSASVSPVPGQAPGSTAKNSISVKNGVHIIPLGDIDQDGNVDIIDVGIVFRAFGSTPGMPLWNPLADINGNGVIDIIDVGVVARNYGIVA
jgi:hypothetical protein